MDRKRFLLNLLRITVVICCLAIVASRVDLVRALERVRATDMDVFGLAVICVLLEPLVFSAKWLLLMVSDRRPPYLQVARAVYTSNFLSIVVPTSLGADVLRVGMLKQRGHSISQTGSALLADRIMSVTCLSLLSALGLVLSRNQMPSAEATWITIAVVALIWCGLFVLALPQPAFVKKLLTRTQASLRAKYPRAAAPFDFLERFTKALATVRRSPRLVLGSIALNLTIQFLRIMQIYFLFRAVHSPVPLQTTFAFVPMVVLLTILPISYFGVGLKEGALIVFFGGIAVSVDHCLATSFLTYIVMLLGFTPGLLLYLMGIVEKRTGQTEAT